MLFAQGSRDNIVLAFGILDIYVSGSPNADFFQGLAARINVTYISISISLNLLLTGLICGRIWYYARDMRKQFGPAFSQTYFSLAAIIIESALPYTLSGIAFVVSNGLHNDITILFLSLYAMFMASACCLEPFVTFANNTFSVCHHRCSFFEWHPEGHGARKHVLVWYPQPCDLKGVRIRHQ